MSRKDRVNKNVTRVEEQKNTTTNRMTPIRFTIREEQLLEDLTGKIQERLPSKNISKSKVLRAVTYIQDESFIDFIVESIKEN